MEAARCLEACIVNLITGTVGVLVDLSSVGVNKRMSRFGVGERLCGSKATFRLDC